MILLAIDPSSSCTGWALFTDGVCTASGYISRRRGVEWWLRLLTELRDVAELYRPDLCVIEDVANRGNNGRLRASSLTWAKSVGIAFAACHPRPIEGYPSNWLKGKPYLKESTRASFAARFAKHEHPITNVDEATAVLFGRWYLDRFSAPTAIMQGTVTRTTVSQTSPAAPVSINPARRGGRKLKKAL